MTFASNGPMLAGAADHPLVIAYIDGDALFDDENFFPDPEAFASFMLTLDYLNVDHVR